MRVEVLIFGDAARAVGSERVAVEVSATPTVREVLAALYAQHPALRFALPTPDAIEHSGRLAVNHAFARGDHPIRPPAPGVRGDEVALVALVGGG